MSLLKTVTLIHLRIFRFIFYNIFLIYKIVRWPQSFHSEHDLVFSYKPIQNEMLWKIRMQESTAEQILCH